MKHNSVILLLFILSAGFASGQSQDFRKQPPKPAPAPKIEMGKYDLSELGNGLKVIVVENRKLPRVSFQLFIDVPPHQEGDKAGLAEMAGQLLKTGTATRSKAQIDEAIDFIGASFSTSSSGMYGSTLKKHQDALLEIMADVLFNPSFPEEEFNKVKSQTLSGLAAGKDDPDFIAGNVATVLRFGKDHPYGEVVTEKAVENITLDGIRNYYQTYFKPNIAYLVIVGDIDNASAKVLAEKYFGKWKRGEVGKKEFAAPQAPGQTQVDFVDKVGAVQSVVAITYPLQLKPGDPDAIKANVMNSLLGGYFGSRLMKNIREDKGYSYGASSGLDQDPVIGYFSAGASVRNQVTDSAITEFLREMERVRTEKVSDVELSMVKSVLTGNFARSLEQPQTIGRFALNIARYKLPADYYRNYLQNLNAVTPADIQAMAQKYVRPGQAHILVVGNKDEVADKLKPFAQGGKVNFYDIDGNPVKAAAAAPSDLTAAKIIDRYIEATGGRQKLAGVRDMEVRMMATVQGMQLEMVRQQKDPDKLAVSVSAGGMTLMQQKYDGKKGVAIQGGQAQAVEGKDLQTMAMQAKPFPELEYGQTGYKLELKGTEKVNDQDAYRVDVTFPSGEKITEFYSAGSGLKIRIIQSGGEGGPTITNDLGDYKSVDGIQFPHTLTVSGMMPIPLKMEVQSIAFNKGLGDEVFKVE